MTGAAWVKRFAKLRLVKKYSDIAVNIAANETSPKTAGSEPISPALTLLQ